MEEKDSIVIDKKRLLGVLKNRRFHWALVVILFLIVLFWGSSIRYSNWDLLVDGTTGQRIPLALDPFYFMRVAETILENNGLPSDIDPMRSPKFNIEWHPEILPDAMVFMYKFYSIFSETTIQDVSVFSPVVFYFLGLIAFFFLCYFLTNKKVVALLASAFLAFVPAYLYRTMAGFSDHEAIGMMALFLCFLSYTIAMKYINKNMKKSIFLGALVSFFSALTIASWGGVAKFVFMVIPSSFILIWLTLESEDRRKSYITFYLSWFIFLFVSGMVFGYPIMGIFGGFVLASYGLISLFTLAFIIVDYGLIHALNKNKNFLFGKEKFKILFVIGGVVVLGVVGLFALGRNPFDIISDIWIRIFHPWGQERVSLTVAENVQPFLVDWIAQTGKVIFWLFALGSYFVGFLASGSIKSIKRRALFVFFWVLMISGILFSRISSGSFFNGTNLQSQVFYVGSVLVALAYFLWIYLNEKVKFGYQLTIIMSWTFFVLIAGKGAARLFFALTPLVCFVAAFFVFEVYELIKRNKEDALKVIFWAGFIVALGASIYTVYIFANALENQAKNTGPSFGGQWQGAMAWVRNNTAEDSLFLHWWDYGYWVQTMGKRATVSDGGHSEGAFQDHLIGRYVLTTPNPDSALSYMKSWGVDYLLIDPTDLGKYAAYSRIGSDVSGNDRYDIGSMFVVDPKQIHENSNSTTYVYNGGYPIFEDIIYESENGRIFLPAGNTAVIGIILEIGKNGTLKQPIVAYQYNGKQTRIPLKNVYIDNRVISFEKGYDATFFVMPSINSQGQLSGFGAGIYLSKKVQDSLFAQLYLMDNYNDRYNTVFIAHKEDSPLVSNLKSQGFPIKDFVFYNGFHGPIKIWQVTYPQDILEREEYLKRTGDWAELDDLVLRK